MNTNANADPITAAAEVQAADSKATPASNAITITKDFLESRTESITSMLPEGISEKKFMAGFYNALYRTPALAACDKTSLLLACMNLAAVGLTPNNPLGLAYLLPYRNNKTNREECQAIIGFQGLLHLCRQSGQIASVEAWAVYDGDVFDYAFGTTPYVHHVPKNTTKDLTHAYAVVRLTSGAVQFDVMTRAEIDAIKDRSKASKYGPWVTDYPEMAKKTVLRRITKVLPKSDLLAAAVQMEEAHVEGRGALATAETQLLAEVVE